MSRIPRTERGPGATPACAKCGTNEHVIRLWHGPVKVWVCKIHFRVRSTETAPMSLRDRVLHKAPEEKTLALTDILPNRAARRRK